MDLTGRGRREAGCRGGSLLVSGPSASLKVWLLESSHSLHALDRIGEGIFALDADGRFTYLNRTAQHLLPALIGASGTDLHGTVIWDASPSFVLTPTATALRRAVEDGLPVVHPVRDPVSGLMLELRAFPSAEGRERVVDSAVGAGGGRAARRAERSLSRLRRRVAIDDAQRAGRRIPPIPGAQSRRAAGALGVGRHPRPLGVTVPGRGVPRRGRAARGRVRVVLRADEPLVLREAHADQPWHHRLRP